MPSQGFRPEQRLRKRREFLRTSRLAERVVTAHFVLLVAPSPESLANFGSPSYPDGKKTAARLGVTVTKRVGNSVRRSRIKRIVRESFRRHQELFPADTDIVVIARKDDPQLSSDDVVKEWKKAAGRIKKACDLSRQKTKSNV
ncbi:MAG: ribonuclease P protein component [Polyangiaceae bacterium]|nr:ribonuclease P protein component [Polyangiaceae bacterium]